MMNRPPLLVRLALAAVRLASLVVPPGERRAWRREWEAELLGAHTDARRRHRDSWRHDMSLFRRATGALSDAAWLRRQFTRDSELVHDLRHGLRIMRRQPGFSALATLVLALGIGTTTAVVTVAGTLLKTDLPFPDAHELVAVWLHEDDEADATRNQLSPGTFVDIAARSSAFAGLAGLEPYSMDYTGGDRPEVIFSTLVTEDFFHVLGVRPLHGRVLQPEDFRAGADRVVVLSHDLWASRFGSDRGLIGRAITLDGDPYTVVGVLPDTFELQLVSRRRGAYAPKVPSAGEIQARGVGWWGVVGRRANGVSLAQANADLARVSDELAAEYPAANGRTRAWAEPLGEHLVANARPAMVMLLGAVALVLLIACANVANMLLARAADRDREFAVRRSLGAGRPRLIRQMLAETGLIATAGTATGMAVAAALMQLVAILAPAELPRLATLAVDGRLVAVAAAAGLGATLLAGILPALQFSRTGRAEVLAAGRSSTGTRASRLAGDGLAVAEIALAVVLVVSAGLLLRSFAQLMSEEPGFQTEHVLALQVFAWDRVNATEAQRAVFFESVIGDLKQLPGVVEAGAVSAMPLIEANIDVQGPVVVEGRPAPPVSERDLVSITMATPEYFATMEIPVLEGRGIAATDRADSELIAVVSDRLARRLWPDETPIDRHASVQLLGRERRVRVVGVVADSRHDGLDRPARPELFVPHAQAPFGSMTFVVRAAGDAAALGTAAQQVVWNHDPMMTFYDMTTVEQLVRASVAPRRFSVVLVGLFAVVALVLAAVGIYGVLSYTTERRRAEFGMRMALGATAADLGRLVVLRGLRLGAAGLVIGLVLTLLAGRVVASALYRVSPFDPLTLAAVAAVVLLLAVAACYVPARRAMRVDPLAALRE